MTGNWDEDSILFSPALAEQRLAAQRAELHRIRAETSQSRAATGKIERRLREARHLREGAGGESAAIRNELAVLQRDLDHNQRELDSMRIDNAEIAGQARSIEISIATQTARIAELRAQLAIILQGR